MDTPINFPLYFSILSPPLSLSPVNIYLCTLFFFPLIFNFTFFPTSTVYSPFNFPFLYNISSLHFISVT